MKIKLGVSNGINVGRFGVARSGGATTPALPSYSSILINTYGASEVWPLVDISSGTTIAAKANAARNGSLVGWDLQNTAGPVTGTNAPYADGANDTGALTTASLQSIYDIDKGAAFIWAKANDANVWTDGVDRWLLSLKGPGANYVYLYKPTTSGQFIFRRADGSVARSVTKTGISITSWFSVGLSWDTSAGGSGELKAFWNGTQEGVTVTSIAAAANKTLSDAYTLCVSTSTNEWNGWGAYLALKFGSIWTPTQFANMHNAAAIAGVE